MGLLVYCVAVLRLLYIVDDLWRNTVQVDEYIS